MIYSTDEQLLTILELYGVLLSEGLNEINLQKLINNLLIRFCYIVCI